MERILGDLSRNSPAHGGTNTPWLTATVLEENEKTLPRLMSLWEEQKLDARLRALGRYRGELNARLGALLNANDDNSSRNQRTKETQSYDIHRSTPVPSNDFVEVLSINKSVQTGLENVAAILTKENGESVTTVPQGVQQALSRPETYNSIITYDLTKNSCRSDSDNSSVPLISHAPDFVDQIRRKLYFREESDRHVAVEDAHCATFHWILHDTQGGPSSHFRDWLRSGKSLFWVNGKAGSGKSTLMKYIHQQSSLSMFLYTWAGSRQLVIAPFFFWQAGQPLQNSFEGILRSLLHQILEKRPDLTAVLFPRLSRYLLYKTGNNDFIVSELELREGIMLLTKNIPEDLVVFLIVDGVDEYTRDHFAFARFLVQVANATPSIKILASSRPTPACYQIFSRCPSIRLQDLTAGDIRAYIDKELVQEPLFQEMNCLEPGVGDEIKAALVDKASGVFLWIVIVVKRVLVSLGSYDDRTALLAKIDELPNDLEKLYDLMFGSMSQEYQQDGSKYLQLIVRARDVQLSQLTARQLFAAFRSINGADILSDALDGNSIDTALRIKGLEGRLRSRCCGLVEVQYGGPSNDQYGGPSKQLKEPRVDFLHRTVYDYLRGATVWDKLANLFKLTLSQIDLALLISSLWIIKHGPTSRSEADTGAALLSTMFSQCLCYSLELSFSGEQRYADLLRMVENLMFHWLRPYPSMHTVAWEYAARELWLSAPKYKLLLPKDFDSFTRLASNQKLTAASPISLEALNVMSMKIIATLGLSEYIGKRIRQTIRDSETGMDLLFHLVNLCRSVSFTSPFAQHYVNNVESLLLHDNALTVYVFFNERIAYKDSRMRDELVKAVSTIYILQQAHQDTRE